MKLMPGVFHMNSEDAPIADSLLAAGPLVGYVPGRWQTDGPPGQGHTAFPAIIGALAAIGYDDNIIVEILPYPSATRRLRRRSSKPGRDPRCERRAREQRNLHSSDGHTELLRREVGSTTPVDPFARMSEKRWGCHPVPTSGS